MDSGSQKLHCEERALAHKEGAHSPMQFTIHSDHCVLQFTCFELQPSLEGLACP